MPTWRTSCLFVLRHTMLLTLGSWPSVGTQPQNAGREIGARYSSRVNEVGRAVRFDMADLQRFVAANRVEAR